MRQVDFSDGYTSASVPTATSLVAALTSYASDAAFVSAKGSAAANGDTYYNTTYHVVRIYLNSAWISQGQIGGNILLNGDFGIWQRGTTVSGVNNTTRAYLADRWSYHVGNAAHSATVARATGTTGSQYGISIQRTAANTDTNGFILTQSIESVNVRQYQGRYLSLSFWAYCGANYSPTSSLLVVRVQTGTGTDQNASTAYTGSANSLDSTATLTTSWQKFSFTFLVPTNATEMRVRFEINHTGTAGAADTATISQVMLSDGGQGRPFALAMGNAASELSACMRYFEKSYTQGTDPAAASTVGMIAWRSPSTSVELALRYTVRKRIAPTVTLYSSDGTPANIRDVSGAANVAATATTYAGDAGCFVQKTTGGTDGSQYGFHYTADAEI